MCLGKLKTIIRNAVTKMYPTNISLGTCNVSIDSTNDSNYNRRSTGSVSYKILEQKTCKCGSKFRESARGGIEATHCRECIVKLINWKRGRVD